MRATRAITGLFLFFTLNGCCDTYVLPDKGSFATKDSEIVRVIVAVDEFERITETYEVGNHIYTVRYERVDD